jgi:sugar phosphate isomerase/epimerase
MNSIYTDKAEYAISSWIYEALPLEEALRDIAGRGYSSVELWADTVHFDRRAKPNLKNIHACLKATGLKVHSVHAPFRHFKPFPNAENFSLYRQKLWHETIDDCAEFLSPMLVVHGLDRKEYNFTLDQIPVLRDSLADLVDYGQKRGVMIALENIPHGSNPDEIPTNLADHVKNFGALGLKYCLDIGHAALNHAGFEDEVDAAGENLVTFHIHNNDGREDLHNIPTDGLIDWPELHDYVRARGYKGQFVMEVLGGSDPRKIMNRIDALFTKG